MHIPDGFLSTPVWLTLDAVSIPAVGYAARRAQRDLDESRVPLLGVMGAFVFAAQMINFPVGVGTSGHLVGSALLAVTLGPAAAMVVMTAVLSVQALVFQDGGILVLGANVLNMALLGTLAAYLPYHFWGAGKLRKLAVFLGGVCSVLVAALLAIGELVFSGVPIPGPVLILSSFIFLVTALLEGLITLVVIQAIETLNPEWIVAPSESPRGVLRPLIVTALLLCVFGVLIASGSPDGLEALAEQVGISSQARATLAAPMAGYEVGFLDSVWLRTALAGLTGLALVFAVCALFSRIASRVRRN